MRIILTGASGYVGRFILKEAVDAGNEVIALGRKRASGPYFDRVDYIPFDLGDPPQRLPSADALIHCAFDHEPGQYRGGEGNRPGRFIRRNFEGSLDTFLAARRSGVSRIIFFSSRAVYDGYEPGTVLFEHMIARPDNLYGHVKWMLEEKLRSLDDIVTTVLRPTGVYGRPWPGAWHKWQDLFKAFEAGEVTEPRSGTEVHGADVAQAVRLVLEAPPEIIDGAIYNISDIRLDRRDLLSAYAAATGVRGKLPAFDFGPMKNVMKCDSIKKLGWSPLGRGGLEAIFS